MHNMLSLCGIAQLLPFPLVLIFLILSLPLPASSLITLAPSPTPSPIDLISYTTSSLSLAPAPASPSPLASFTSQYSWIVEGNSTGKLAPNCSDLCVMVNNENQNFSVALQPCQGLSSSELWIYDSQSMAIISNLGHTSDVKLCVDASTPEQLQLTACNGSIAQTWIWDNQTMRFSSGINDTSTGAPMFLKGEIRPASDWGSGINNFALQLAKEDTDTNYDDVFTVIPFYDPLLIYPPASNSGLQNLVINSGFEKCGWDPGKGFVTIGDTEQLYLCSWFIVSNEVEYSGTNLWQPEEGTHSLHLNSAKIGQPGAVTQVLATKIRSNYTLIFFMAGNPDLNCGTTNKTMQVEVNPSSLQAQHLWFDVSKAGTGQMGWKQVYTMGFTALADYVNLTFKSLTPGSCGPVIDNITVQEIKGPLPPLNPYGLMDDEGSSSSSMPTYARVLIWVAVTGCVIGIISLLIMWVMKIKARANALRMRGRSNGSSSSPGGGWWDSFQLANIMEGDEGRNENAGGNCIKELTWKQIEKATKNFTTIVGEGGFSTVYRAELSDGTVGAVKMEKTRDRSRQIFKQELSVLSRLRHPNLVNLLGFCNEREEGILVFEYMAHGSLHHRLHPPAHQMYVSLSWKKRTEVALQVARALQYLHEEARPPVVHGDVKSANVLLDEEDNAKVCDFGFSSKAGPDSSVFHSTVASVKGSLGYLDPHYLKNGRLSSKSDVYSFGVLLMELLTGLHAFDMHRAEALTSFAAPYVQDMDMMQLIVDARLTGAFDRSELATVCHVARLCVQEEAASRPTMAEVVCQLSSAAADAGPPHQDDCNALSPFISP